MTVALAMILRPFVLLLVMVVFCAPVTYAIRRWMRDGALKRLLLRPIGRKQTRRD